MAGTGPQIEWYLAREGAQHGPLSDVEMRTFVQMGHLRPTDLVWRAGFPDWRPGPQAFPEIATPQQSAEPQRPAGAQLRPQASPQATGSAADPARTGAGPSKAGGSGDIQRKAASAWDQIEAHGAASQQPVVQNTPQNAGFSRGQASAQQPSAERLAWEQAAREHAAREQAEAANAASMQAGANPTAAPRTGSPQTGSPQTDSPQTGSPRPAFGSLQAALRAPLKSRLEPRAPAQLAPGAQFGHPSSLERTTNSEFAIAAGAGAQDLAPGSRIAAAQPGDDDDDDDDAPAPRRSFVRTAAFAAVTLILLGSGWIAWQNRSMLPGMSAVGGVMLARLSSQSSIETYQLAPFLADGDSRDDLDRSLQKTALWRLLKRDYADWYGERLADVERMRQQKADEKTVSKFLADVVVVQRRKTAAIALAASPEHLRQMAAAFLGNLKQLAARDAQSCFGFISFGEASAYMLELTKTSTFAEPMQRQLIAVFEAVADGRKAPKFYAATRRTDYDVLTAELTARGWTQDDLLTFSDARRLSSSPPDKVCRMVQDWFTVQLSLKDPELQGRLLSESLKPLVNG